MRDMLVKELEKMADDFFTPFSCGIGFVAEVASIMGAVRNEDFNKIAANSCKLVSKLAMSMMLRLYGTTGKMPKMQDVIDEYNIAEHAIRLYHILYKKHGNIIFGDSMIQAAIDEETEANKGHNS